MASQVRFHLDASSDLPIFEQLQKQLLEAIALGQLQPHDQLPSVRSLAMELGINPNTISKAYQQLETMGMVETQKGKGCFVGQQTPSLIHEKQCQHFIQVIKQMKAYALSKEELIHLVEEHYGV